jgi:hypothetical protein
MPAGGRRAGAGRPGGLKNKRTIEAEFRAVAGIEAALADGIMPLDVMLAKMRRQPLNGELVSDAMFQAACAAAPYLHPKLSAALVKDVSTPVSAEARDARIMELLEKGTRQAALMIQQDDDGDDDDAE